FFSLGRYGTTMRVYVVDNGGQWTHREWRGTNEPRADKKIVPEEKPCTERGRLDGRVLHGGAPRRGRDAGKGGRYRGARGPVRGRHRPKFPEALREFEVRPRDGPEFPLGSPERSAPGPS